MADGHVTTMFLIRSRNIAFKPESTLCRLWHDVCWTTVDHGNWLIT